MGLTTGQQMALEKVRKGYNVFLTGGGGVGKTYLINRIVSELEAAGKSVLLTAPTGRAAMLIGGVTCHRAFRIPISATWQETPVIRKSSPVYASDVVLIDEVSMLRIDVFEYIINAIDQVNHIRTTEEYLSDPSNVRRDPVQLIVVGDFCQLPPVIKHPSDGDPDADEGHLMSDHYGFDVGHGYAFLSPGWSRCEFVMCELTEVIRQSDEPMISALNGIRFGDRRQIPFFQKHARKKKFSENDKEVIYLCGKNRTADRINLAALSRLPGKEYSYHAVVKGTVSEQDKQAPELIRLKVGTHVIMLQNTEKFRNGSSGTVTSLRTDSISVLIHETGEEVEVSYFTWAVEKYVVEDKKVKKEQIGSFSQLPIRLGYAITIHKSQGATFDKVTLVLGSDDKKKGAKSTIPEIFAYGQLYVALSRVKSMEGLYIEGNLELVTKLAAPEVLEFYGKSNMPDIQDSMPENPITVPTITLPKAEQYNAPSPKKTHVRTVNEADRLASAHNDTTPNPTDLHTSKKEDLVAISCPRGMIQIAWIFAQALSPDSELEGDSVLVPSKYKVQAESFIKALY